VVENFRPFGGFSTPYRPLANQNRPQRGDSTHFEKHCLKRFARASKNEPLVEEVDLVSVNPAFARVRCPGGCEFSVILRDLAPCPDDVALRPTKRQCPPPEP